MGVLRGRARRLRGVPQYGGRVVEPEGNPEKSSCASYYQTPDSEEEVFAYFRERFEEHGWELAPSESYRMEGGELVPADLVAHRGDFSYRVSVEKIDPRASGHAPGTHVAAHVSHRPRRRRNARTRRLSAV